MSGRTDDATAAFAAMLKQFPELRDYAAALDPRTTLAEVLESYGEILRLRVVYARDHGPDEGAACWPSA